MPVEVLEREDEDLLLGKTLSGSFYVEKLLAKGGMGRVYRTTQLSVDRPVALKTVGLLDLGDPRATKRFFTEARAASKLSGPHVVRLYDFNIDPETGLAYIVMEYVDGPNLREVLAEEGPLPVTRAADIAYQIALALCEARSADIVHRDLKPENTLIVTGGDGRERVKVTDFGLAKVLGDARLSELNLTTLGRAMGTPPYLAPEQARGQKTDASADLYALGCMLHEMLLGEPPLKREEALDRPWRALSWPVTPLPETLPAAGEPVPEALELLHASLLQPRAELRVGDPRPVATILQALRDGDEIDAEALLTGAIGGPSTEWAQPLRDEDLDDDDDEPGSDQPRRRSTGALWIVALALLAALATFVSYPGSVEEPAAPEVKGGEPETPGPEPGTAATKAGTTVTPPEPAPAPGPEPAPLPPSPEAEQPAADRVAADTPPTVTPGPAPAPAARRDAPPLRKSKKRSTRARRAPPKPAAAESDAAGSAPPPATAPPPSSPDASPPIPLIPW